MKILLLIILILVIVFIFGVIYLKYRLTDTPDNINLEASLDSEVKKVTRGDSSHGLVIGIYKDGKTFIKGYGTVNKDNTMVPDGMTIFQIGSVTKLFTASTYQILSDEILFDMDATLDDLIGTTVELSPEAKEVTLRQLATHTSGFPSIPKPLEREVTRLVAKENLMENPYGHLGVKYIFDYLKTTEGKRAPGRSEYSNYGMGLLGHVMEAVTKKDYEFLVTEKLLAPLDMRSTTITLTPEMKNRLAQGYTDKGEPSPVWTFFALSGAGAFNSNAEDMLKFIQANIENSSQLSGSLKKMHGQQFGGNTGIGWMLPTFIDRFVGNKYIVWHNGRVGGYTSYISIDTKNETGVVVLSNKSVDMTMLGMMLMRKVRTQSWTE